MKRLSASGEPDDHARGRRREGGCARFPHFSKQANGAPMSETTTIHAAFAAHVADALEALVADCVLPAGLPLANVSGRAAARCRRTATSRPTPRWCWPSPPGPIRARWPKRSRGKLEALADVTGSRHRRAGLHQSARCDRAHGWASCARSPRSGPDYGRSTMGAGRQGQRRIRLGQPDRPDAHGPLPRRGGRRCAGDACSSIAGLRRDRANITSTMPAAQVADARALGPPALPRGAGRGRSRFPDGYYPGDYLVPIGRRSLAEDSATATSTRPKANGSTCSASARSRR